MDLFTLTRTAGHARAGELTTTHGRVLTPVFMPVGSQATVKTMTPGDLREIGVGMILANTYHLYLRPGAEVIEKLGGLHRFMAWHGSILTDSGGYQIFSLAQLRKVSDEGARFRSHIDGSEHFITPEKAIRLQESLGADIIMAFDECPSYGEPPERIRAAMERTHRWAEACLKAKSRPNQALFGIVQGGFEAATRQESARVLTALDFAGYAVGGLSIGEPKSLTREMLEVTVPLLPEAKPRYLMGVGAPEDLLEGIELGIDMFDCVLPTRVARNGALFTAGGRRNIRNSLYRDMPEPVDPACDCYTCRTFSAAYLHHLFSREELLAYRLATIHNLTFLHRLMTRARSAIIDGSFADFKACFLAGYQTTNEETRIEQKQRWLDSHRSAKPLP